MHPFRRRTHLPWAATALVVSAALAPCAPGQEKPNPLVAQVKAAVKDPTRPFTLLVRFEAKEGAGPRIEAAFAKAVRLTRREKGCLAYDFSRDARVPTRFLVYERWQNVAALEAHQNSAHIAALRQEINDLRAAPPAAEVLLPAGE